MQGLVCLWLLFLSLVGLCWLLWVWGLVVVWLIVYFWFLVFECLMCWYFSNSVGIFLVGVISPFIICLNLLIGFWIDSCTDCCFCIVYCFCSLWFVCCCLLLDCVVICVWLRGFGVMLGLSGVVGFLRCIVLFEYLLRVLFTAVCFAGFLLWLMLLNLIVELFRCVWVFD